MKILSNKYYNIYINFFIDLKCHLKYQNNFATVPKFKCFLVDYIVIHYFTY